MALGRITCSINPFVTNVGNIYDWNDWMLLSYNLAILNTDQERGLFSSTLSTRMYNESPQLEEDWDFSNY